MEFGRSRGLSDDVLGVLRCFAGPHPRGGPPAPPEGPWDDSFDALEQHCLNEPLEAVADHLHEVDRPQAELFARRLGAVDESIAALGDDTGRVLRVGLRLRARGILRSPSGRAIRIRALADFYYSITGLHRHRRRGGAGLSLEDLAGRVEWAPVADGLAHARLEGASDLGPLHVNLLRVDPGTVRLRVEDCRPAVARGIDFATHVQDRGAAAGISGGFFLYSEPDIEAPSRRHDPVGLLMEDGEVRSPPVFERGAVLISPTGTTSIGRVGLSHVRMQTPDGTRFTPTGAMHRARASVGPDTPSAAIVGHEVVAVGRLLPVPLNGFVVPLPSGLSLQAGDRVTYPEVAGPHGPIRAGIAGGPVLLHNGELALDMRREDFWGSAPPVTFSQDETGDRNLLPRLAAGSTPEGHLLLAAIDGRNFDRALGMTLHGVARLLQALGCTEATNLDGGSSKRMVVHGRALDLASTEIVAAGKAKDSVRPVHTGLLLYPRA